MSIEVSVTRPIAEPVATAQPARPARVVPPAVAAPDRGVSVAAGVPDGSSVALDPGTGRVVFEHFDATGTLVNSIPSRQQLEAYRLAALAGDRSK